MKKLKPYLKKFLGNKDHQLFIGGRYVKSKSAQRIEVFNPSNEELLGTVALASKSDVNRAVQSAGKAFHRDSTWRTMSPDVRAQKIYSIANKIEEHAESLAQLITLENGKLIRDARSSDVNGAAKTFRYYAGWATKIEGETLDLSQSLKPGKQSFSYTQREPIGVVAAIVPWNFPISIAAWKIAPALAAGCTVVLKPSEETPLSALMLAQLAKEAGLPAGVLNVVTGNGTITGSALTNHSDIGKITFTGSTATGKIIGKAAMDNVIGVSLELGGKSPAVVFDDIKDIDEVAKGVVAGIFRNQGQVCVAGSRVYIQKKIFRKVIEALSNHTKKLKVGDGFDERADIGPLVSENHLKKVCHYIDSGIEEGAKLVAGGKPIRKKGHYLRPTIFQTKHNNHKIVREEIFGPVLVAVPFDTTEEAIALANDSTMGLAATVWTSDISKAMTLVNRLQAGVVYVNSPVRSDPNLPLGGYKHSGIGSELGKAGVYAYTILKSVNLIY